MEQTKEKKYIVGSIICGLLTAFGIVGTITSLIGSSKSVWLLSDCLQLLLLFLIIFYAFIGYKKPHGNLLKFIMLFRIIMPILVGIPTLTEKGYTTTLILFAFEIGITCYVAGRLSKVKENLVLMIIATVLEAVSHISVTSAGTATIGVITPVIIWLDICVAYFLRYKQHREAGLEDAPKK